MKRSHFFFHLQDDLIAQHPPSERDGARLLVVDASNGVITHSHIRELPQYLPTGTICVPNDVKVRQARLTLRRPGGGSGEALLHKALGNNQFEALVRPGAKLKKGKKALIINPSDNSIVAELLVVAELDEGLRVVQLQGEGAFDWDRVDSIGRLPLPPYIKRDNPTNKIEEINDRERYQTIFHAEDGEAVAAPTAGLHFTTDLIERLKQKNCKWCPIRLHVGLGTFRPMTAEDIEDHAMHEEFYEIPETTSRELEKALVDNSGNILAIGTTSLRTLESAWDGTRLKPCDATRLFIRPGYKIITANHLLTNFHLPESTLFVLVCAILGIDLAQHVYETAIKEKYSFFSYGDGMLIRSIK